MVGLVRADEAGQEGGREAGARKAPASNAWRSSGAPFPAFPVTALSRAGRPALPAEPSKRPERQPRVQTISLKHQLLGRKVAELCFFLSLLRPSVCPGSVSTPALLISAGL